MMNLLQFKSFDIVILNKIYENFAETSNKKKLEENIYNKFKSKGKWYLNILDNEIYKYIRTKCRELIGDL